VDLAHPVEVHDEGEPRVRLEDVEELLQPERIREIAQEAESLKSSI